MKKLISFFLVAAITLTVAAADLCRLTTTASQCDGQLCFDIVPRISWADTQQTSFDLLFVVYFYDSELNKLISPDDEYRSADNQVAANASYHLSSDDTNAHINICIPVEELHLPAGVTKFCYKVEVFSREADGFVSLLSEDPVPYEFAASEAPTEARTAEKPDEVQAELHSQEAVVDSILAEPVDTVAVLPAVVERATTRTFKREYRCVWDKDDNVYEEIRFAKDGTVAVYRVFKKEETLQRKGRYVVYELENSPKLTIRIEWNKGQVENNWTLAGTSGDHNLVHGSEEWIPVTVLEKEKKGFFF